MNLDMYDLLVPDFIRNFDAHLQCKGVNPDGQISDCKEAERLSTALQGFISQVAGSLNSKQIRSYTSKEDNTFYIEFHRFWSHCLQLSQVHERLIIDLAADKTHIESTEDNRKEYVLSKLLGRGIRTYQEINLLIKNGYPYGAISLTRTLYELAIITRFIEMQDDCVARAYYNSSSDSVDTNSSYEWARASGAFKEKEKIRFSRIREITGFNEEKHKELYTIYCNFAHGSPQIVNNEVGADTDAICVGPTIFGIEAPAIFASMIISEIFLAVFFKSCSEEQIKKGMFCIEWARYLKCEYEKKAAVLNGISSD